MNKLDYTNKLWKSKHISAPDKDWFIVKEFNTKELMLSIHEQRKILNTKQKYFWEYIPETILCETGNWEYFIKQKYVNWKTLSQIDISVLSENTLSDLIDLIKKYIKYHKEQWWELDLTWYQQYKWNPKTLKRMILNFLKINQNFLASTNIMISNDWHVYMVDVCESTDIRLQWKFKNFCAKPFIKRTIFKLEKILQQKREHWEYKSELLSVIDNQN